MTERPPRVLVGHLDHDDDEVDVHDDGGPYEYWWVTWSCLVKNYQVLSRKVKYC